MPSIHTPRPWHRPAPDFPVLEESAWLDRRRLLRLLGLGGIAALAPGSLRAQEPSEAAQRAYPLSARWVPPWDAPGGAALYPAERDVRYNPGRPLTPENVAATHNNFYEFLPGRGGAVHRYTDELRGRPWTVAVAGEVEQELELDLDEVARVAPLEERYYRFRCVERWAMTVPWTGYSLSALIAKAQPKPSAKFVRFLSFHDPEVAPGQKVSRYEWPYYEGLRLDEALHPLAMVVTGIYGHALPAQHGAPVRIVVPWKYGYKSPKSVVRIELVSEQPRTFWQDEQPKEYPFLSNVEPDVPHPRWSQRTEEDLATGDKRPTLLYNGYANEVSSLYA